MRLDHLAPFIKGDDQIGLAIDRTFDDHVVIRIVRDGSPTDIDTYPHTQGRKLIEYIDEVLVCQCECV